MYIQNTVWRCAFATVLASVSTYKLRFPDKTTSTAYKVLTSQNYIYNTFPLICLDNDSRFRFKPMHYWKSSNKNQCTIGNHPTDVSAL